MRLSEPSSGLRRVTPLSFLAHKQARSYAHKPPAITRLAALQVVKRAAPALGLKGVKLAVIDALFAFSQAQDWTDAASRPLIWPSNAALAARLGLSVPALKHHLRGLRNAGLIACSDHPTYQRRGGRDAGGRITEAYGIDLSPIAMRFGELAALAEAHEAATKLRRTLARERTVLRKAIAAILESVGGLSTAALAASNWLHLQARLDQIRERKAAETSEMERVVQDLEILLGDVEAAYEEFIRGQNLIPAAVGFDPLQITNEDSDFVICKAVPGSHAVELGQTSALPEGKALFDQADRKQTGEETGQGMERRSGGRANSGPTHDEGGRKTTPEGDEARRISLPLLTKACPEVAELAPEAFSNWKNLCGSTLMLCRLASISPEAWRQAREALGVELGVSALVLTIQRLASGKVENANGYLLALARRHRLGELRLTCSLHALAKKRAG